MPHRAWLAWSSLLLALPALACSEDPGTNDSGADSGADSPSADAPSDANLGDGGGDTGPGFDAGPGVCDPAATWGANQSISVSTSQSDLLGSVTADELSIAWMTAQGTVLYADRQSTSSAFGAPQTLTGAIALDQVALSGDGLTLVVVLQDRSSLAQTTRASRSAAFSSALDTSLYAQLDPAPTEGDAGANLQGLFADPVLSNDNTILYYSQIGVSIYTMHESYRPSASGPWSQGRNLIEKDFVAPSLAARQRPTGFSADDRTLFFWNEGSSIERVAFRDGVLMPHNTYKQFTDVGAYENAEPALGCARIYFSSAGAGGLDLFYADKQ